MFGSAKPTASLSSSLLARKGQARPAMRPQGFVGLNPGTSLDDLGWNDMGEAPLPETAPPVLQQRQALAEELATPAIEPASEIAPPPAPVIAPQPSPVEPSASVAPRAVSANTAARIGREVAAKKHKAAFTLRLDQERHLKLRLASAVSGRSAQHLVTEALDAFLETLPEVGALASQLPIGKARRSGGN